MMARTFHPDHSLPTDPEAIWVFGSNLIGLHGAGAARVAHESFGAIPGEEVGRHGQSYAIPTKDERMQTLSLPVIASYVTAFLFHARMNPETTYFVTAVGCGLAGYAAKDIAPMFAEATENCSFPDTWEEYLA
jgi:hypothetical protein